MTIDNIIITATWVLPLLVFLAVTYLSYPQSLLIVRQIPEKLLYFLLFFLVISTGCRVDKARITRKDRVWIDGSEVPGIGGTKEKPDTCIAYYDTSRRMIILRYIR